MLLDTDELMPHYEKLMTILGKTPLKVIKIFYPLEICKQRNVERGDRGINQSYKQSSIMAKNIKYDIVVDTSLRTPGNAPKLFLIILLVFYLNKQNKF